MIGDFRINILGVLRELWEMVRGMIILLINVTCRIVLENILYFNGTFIVRLI